MEKGSQRYWLTGLVFVILSCQQVFSQIGSIQTMSANVNEAHRMGCGLSSEQMLQLHQTYMSNLQAKRIAGNLTSDQMNFPAALIQTCGMFRLYYADDLRTIKEGFADPVYGALRRNTFCAVLNYIQGVINIPAGNTIDIWIDSSYTASYPAPAGVGFLANAGPYFPAGYGSVPGVYPGHMYTHITSGVDPDVNNYDARVQVNFDKTTDPYTMPVGYWEDYTNTTNATCVYDLYSVLLHEITHALGWFSNVSENVTSTNLSPVCAVANNGFSLMDFKYFYYGDVKNPSSFNGNKLVVGTQSNPSINPAINTYTTPLRANSIWINNHGTPENHPVYSGEGFVWYPVKTKSLMSHMNYNTLSFTAMSQYSPGFQPKYVMAPSFGWEEMRRSWTLFEIRTLLDMGYTLKPSFAASTSLNGTDVNSVLLLSNHPPFRNNPGVEITGYSMVSHEQVSSDYTLINNNTSSSPAQSTLTINLVSAMSMLNIADVNGDQVRIMPGSLFGMRGVSNGGNNHALLTVNSQGTIITYTPSPGYVGKAQFAFHLWDGHEQGALKVITINVQPGTYTVAAGSELVINGGFEDGTEVRLQSNTSLPYSSLYNRYVEGEINYGFHEAGAHPYAYAANRWAPFGGGIIVHQSDIDCSNSVIGQSGFITNSSSGPTASSGTIYNPPPPGNTGVNQRVSRVGYSPGYCFNTLINPLKNCSTYVFECDFGFPKYGFFVQHALGDVFSFNLEFTADPANDLDNVTVLQSIPITLTVTAICGDPNADWQHFTTTFNYCGAQPSRFFRLNTTTEDVYIDNLSVRQSAPNPLTATISPYQSTVCPGTAVTLNASVANAVCSTSYTWQPGNLNVNPAVVSPTASTVYTLTVKDCYRTYTLTTPVFISPAFSYTGPLSYTVCSGMPLNIPLTGAPSGINFNWNAASTSTDVTGFTSGTGTVIAQTLINNGTAGKVVTYTITPGSGCSGSPKIVSVTVLPIQIISVTSPATICAGNSATLTASGALSYTWTGAGGTSMVNPWIVTPTITTSYTVTGLCSGSKTVTVSVLATPVLTLSPLNPTICIGNTATVTASGANSYTWSSGTFTTVTNPVVLSPTASTVYTVTGTNLIGCKTSKVFTVTAAPLPTVSIAVSSQSICMGNTATLTASGANSYTWSSGSGGTSMQNPLVVIPTATTNYTVIGRNVSGCIASKTISLVVLPVGAFTVSPLTQTACAGSAFTYTAAGANSYTWVGAGTTTTANPVVLTPSISIIYTVSGTFTNGCMAFKTVTASVLPLPALNISATSTLICTGNSTTLAASGANTYTWTGGGLTVVSPTVVISPTVTTTYTVVGSNASGCLSSAVYTMNVTGQSGKPVSLSYETKAPCPGEEIKLVASNVMTYSWTTSPAVSYTPDVSGAIIYSAPVSTTTFSVKGTDNIGCVSTASVAITISPNPVFTVSVTPTPLCTGQTATLTASGTQNYIWFSTPTTLFTQGINSSTVTTVPLTSAFTLTLTGTSLYGCSSTTMLAVPVSTLCAPIEDCSKVPCSQNYTADFVLLSPSLIDSTSLDARNGSSYSGLIGVPYGAGSVLCNIKTVTSNTVSYTWTMSKIAGPGSPQTICTNVSSKDLQWPGLAAGQYSLTLKMLISNKQNNQVYTCAKYKSKTFGVGTGYYGLTVARTSMNGDNQELQNFHDFSWTVYPNPASAFMLIDWNLHEGELADEIIVYDLDGRLIEQLVLQGNSGKMEINTETYRDGLYVIRLKTNTGIYHSRVSVQR